MDLVFFLACGAGVSFLLAKLVTRLELHAQGRHHEPNPILVSNPVCYSRLEIRFFYIAGDDDNEAAMAELGKLSKPKIEVIDCPVWVREFHPMPYIKIGSEGGYYGLEQIRFFCFLKTEASRLARR